jgi:hypothetical protein
VAEPDSTVFGDANRSMVPGRFAEAEALDVLGTLDGGKGYSAVFDWFVGNDILRFALSHVLG